MRWFKLLTPADKILVCTLAASAMGSWIWMASPPPSGERYVVVEVGGREVRRFPLRADGPGETMRIELPRGEGILEVSGGRAWMRPMDRQACPAGICFQMGPIDRPGAFILCAPNGLVVRVEGKGEDAPDGLTY